MDKLERQAELTRLLNKAAKAYYIDNNEIMPNIEYDRLYDELLEIEAQTGVVLSESPTINVGYEILGELPKEAHDRRMLSLDKTKDVETLVSWLGEEEGILSWKLDGLTIVLTYIDGKLHKAVTRGNGEVGEVITNNARVFKNLPLVIPQKGEVILRGEAVIPYAEFEKINSLIEDVDLKYKNPRNLCSGTVRQLNNQITAERNVHFYAFAMVKEGEAIGEGLSPKAATLKKREEQLEELKNMGFEVVKYKKVTAQTLHEAIDYFGEAAGEYGLPVDGLVMTFDDIAYGEALGETAKFPRNSIAFKWKDETRETTLREIEWSASRTGLINPIAIFEPVELEGTTVSRASVHNISILKELKLGIGDLITVYKANMIIPQIYENLTKSGGLEIPKLCPVCGGATEIRQEREVEALACQNPDCQAKHIKRFSLFVSRDALNIEGLSEATLEKLIGLGIIKEFIDIFKLEGRKDEIVGMEGFGEKSYQNLIAAAEKARKTTAVRLLYGLGIANIGVTNAKVISKACNYDFEKIQAISEEALVDIWGVGAIMAKAYVDYFSEEANIRQIKKLLEVLEIEAAPEVSVSSQRFEGKTFVITGALNHFENRTQLKEKIEVLGGKTAGSVSSKTDYLINNDNLSSSSKNKSAKELGIPVITEEEFLNMLKRGADNA